MSVHLRGFGIGTASAESDLAREYAARFGEPPAMAPGEREYRKARWPDPVSLVGLRAARRALRDLADGDRDCDLIIATDTAGHESRAQFREELTKRNGRAANPTRFLSGLFNVPAATIASTASSTIRHCSIVSASRWRRIVGNVRTFAPGTSVPGATGWRGTR